MRHAVHIHAHALSQLHAPVSIADTGHKVGAGDVLHGVGHGDAPPGGGQVDFMTQPGDLVGAQNLLGGAGEDALQNIHHAVQVGERLVQLTGGELGIVLGVHALVAEDAAHLVHPLHTADDKPLQVQLCGDAHIHINILGIVVGDEGSGVGAAGNGAENGSLHLHEAQAVQIAAQIGHKLAADLKIALRLGVHNEVHIALAIAHFLIGKAVELLGQGPQGFTQQGDVLGPDTHLALFRAEHGALNTDDVADVVLLEAVIFVQVHLVPAGIELDAAGLILQIAEGDLAHAALGHEAAAYGDGLPLQGVKIILNFLGVVGDIILGNGKRVHPRILQGLEFITAHL